MPTVIPYVPQNITVHLGPPSSSAANVTVPFTDYVKNVASSEIYPTWEESALRANILAIISYALNRVYTEYYRSRGYDFEITNSTAYDQFFVYGRSYFSNISRIVDQIFNNYLRRPGFVEPLAAKFCNGTTAVCEGLSQWGSQNLALQGYSSVQILRSYYGNVEIVTNAPIRNITASYPGTPLRRGSSGPNVVVVQVSLNRISQNYPAIPKLATVDGIYGSRTEEAVRRFQQIFGLGPDGIVGPSTWYALVRTYTAVTQLSELRSQGQRYYSISWNPSGILQEGSTGEQVRRLQYMLSVLSRYIPSIPPLTIDGIYGSATRDAVYAAQRRFGLPLTGRADSATWDKIYNQYSGIENTSFRVAEVFPYSGSTGQGQAIPAGAFRVSGNSAVRIPSLSGPYAQSSTMAQFPGDDLSAGRQDPVAQEVVR